MVEELGRSTALLWLAEAKVVDTQTALRHNLIDHITERSDWEDEIWKRAQHITRNDRAFIKNLKEGAMRITQARWEAIEAELDSFAQFWESDLHEERVEKFLNRK